MTCFTVRLHVEQHWTREPLCHNLDADPTSDAARDEVCREA